MIEPVRTDFVFVHDKDDIVFLEFFEREELSLEDAKKLLDIALKFSDGRKRLILADLRSVKNINQLAVKFLTGMNFKPLTKASAVLVSPMNPLTRIGITLFLKLNREIFPLNFFTNEEEAIEWLKQQE
jgi:hypothetical protein